MNLFLSTYINKVDKKGRVSIPAPFRSVVKNHDFIGIVIYRSFINNCIEASSIDRINRLSDAIEHMDVFSETRDAFAMSLLGESIRLAFDPDGRVTLPIEMLESLEIENQAAFVGKGKIFEIWSPQELQKHKEQARKISIKHRNELNFNRSEK
ncbi:MAG: cell division/cell wall cluster transcriptional repressor MraZ [Rickettsiaceae bacterium H1]|nr:cell division/cell wall cluster transcriptional repressor MraZ [Rickettsiaceae bacterium H1]